MVYNSFWRRLCLRGADLQLFCKIRHMVSCSCRCWRCCIMQCFLHIVCGLQENMRSMITVLTIMHFTVKFAPIFSNLFEVLYICVMCVAPAVAFATGGATLSESDRTAVSVVYASDRRVYFHRSDFWNRPGTKSSLGSICLHHRRAADRIYSEYYCQLLRDTDAAVRI